MRLPQRFKLLPSEEPGEQPAVPLQVIPAHFNMDVKSATKDDVDNKSRPVHTDTEYNAGNYTVSHPTTFIDRVETLERHKFGTRFIGRFHDNFIAGWRAGLIRAFLLSFVALIVNISVYVWLFSTYDVQAGTGTIQSGNCSTIRGTNTAIHAALNVLSTLILGASTYAMQGITAPTRKEVDAAHAKGKWVEIGTQSLRNLFYVPKRNAFVWVLLGVTSIPLHLVFNAVFFTTTQANQYAVAVVQESIFSNTTFQPTAENSSPDLFNQGVIAGKCTNCTFDVRDNSTVVDLIQSITNNPNLTEFERMEPLECMQTYSSGFMQGYGNVIVVSKSSAGNSPVLHTRFPQRSIISGEEHTNQDPYHWICHDVITSSKDGKKDRCSLDMATERFHAGRNWTVYKNPVSYCLARPIPDTCDLQFNRWLMLGVVCFGSIKAIVIAYLVFARPSGRSLRTLGDAIASFLEEEDVTTKEKCLVSSHQFRKHGLRESYAPQVFTGDRPRWLSSANTTEFFSSIGVSAFYIFVLSIALYFAIDGAKGFAFSNGLGVPEIQSLASFKADDVGSSGIVPTLVIANIPQLGFSLLFIVYNSLWSKLLVAHEFDRMTRAKKGLRVSERPRGKQRASHFFTLPARYALPLMGCSTALHWLCSQSFFMVRIDGVNSSGVLDEHDRLVRLGYSASGVVSLIGVAVALMVATVCVGAFRRLWTGLGETCMSVVISAACHPWRYETEPWLQEVQWGDVTEERPGGGEQVVRHISFSGRLVDRPIVGQVYR
ncbi:hypothetical protein GQ44DRAFT_672608 [Phaeosphaeriaceae sp. PMI808]|nr:hypothetical protein GQ44DRAFT_672608 [Phaeosphaeriaceae sp. PMI808]